MEETEVGEIDRELRQLLRDSGLDRVVAEVDATISEGRSQVERRKIDKGAASEELVAIDYTPLERYELMLDAIRRAVVEPSEYEVSAEQRLIERAGANSVTFVDPEGSEVRLVADRRPPAVTEADPRTAERRHVDGAQARAIDDVLAMLDPRPNPKRTSLE